MGSISLISSTISVTYFSGTILGTPEAILDGSGTSYGGIQGGRLDILIAFNRPLVLRLNNTARLLIRSTGEVGKHSHATIYLRDSNDTVISTVSKTIQSEDGKQYVELYASDTHVAGIKSILVMLTSAPALSVSLYELLFYYDFRDTQLRFEKDGAIQALVGTISTPAAPLINVGVYDFDNGRVLPRSLQLVSTEDAYASPFRVFIDGEIKALMSVPLTV